jgi:hypothetical protein
MELIKWKAYLDFEKEEKWINEMSQKGWHFKKYTFFRYHFEKGEANKYIFRLQMLNNRPNHIQSQEYIQFLEDSGIEVVSSFSSWIFMRQLSEKGAFEVFTDFTSKIKNYKSVRLLIGIICLANICIGISNSAMLGSRLSHLGSVEQNMFLINIGLGLLFVPYIYRLTKKIKFLEKEQALHE